MDRVCDRTRTFLADFGCFLFLRKRLTSIWHPITHQLLNRLARQFTHRLIRASIAQGRLSCHFTWRLCSPVRHVLVGCLPVGVSRWLRKGFVRPLGRRLRERFGGTTIVDETIAVIVELVAAIFLTCTWRWTLKGALVLLAAVCPFSTGLAKCRPRPTPLK
jgi:hypothetical protein